MISIDFYAKGFCVKNKDRKIAREGGDTASFFFFFGGVGVGTLPLQTLPQVCNIKSGIVLTECCQTTLFCMNNFFTKRELD